MVDGIESITNDSDSTAFIECDDVVLDGSVIGVLYENSKVSLIGCW